MSSEGTTSLHSYAEDTQLYMAVSPDDTGLIYSLLNCILEIKAWLAQSVLQFNQTKTEVLIIGSEAQLDTRTQPEPRSERSRDSSTMCRVSQKI